MSKRILTDNLGSKIVTNRGSIHTWAYTMAESLDNLYAVIIADDNKFEGL